MRARTLVVAAACALAAEGALAEDVPTSPSPPPEDGTAAVESVPGMTGREIRTPEGYLRLEEGGPEVPGVGTFAVEATGRRELAAPPSAPPGGPPEVLPTQVRAPAGELPPRPDACRPERGRYLRRLLQMQGIDVADPLALLEGLSSGPVASPFLFTEYGALGGVEPIRPLAWDLELRSLARELAACASHERRSLP